MKKSGRKRDENLKCVKELSKEQAERIRELKKENSELSAELETYRAREKEITETLSEIKRKEEAFNAEIKIKYALECERLSAFRKKWITAAHNGTLKADCERTTKILRECQAAMEKSLCDDLGTEDYFYERERLDDEPNLNYKSIIDGEQISETDPADSIRNKDRLSERELADLIEQI